MVKKPKAYSYIRMSTELQLRGDSRRRQLEGSKKYADEHGLELVEDFDLEDIGFSAFTGANIKEGALGRFLEAAKKKKIPAGSYLLVESLDRISRQEIRSAQALFLSILNCGINIVTIADGHEYNAENYDIADMVISLMILSRAHEESKIKSQRIKEKWAQKRLNASTKKLTKICPAWLKLSKDRTHFLVKEQEAKIVKSIFEDADAGLGIYVITRRLNERRIPWLGASNGWHSSYISRILANKAVIGEFQPQRVSSGRRVPVGDAIPDYYPPIIDRELFYRVQHAKEQRSRAGAGRKGPGFANLFSGLLYCGYCQSNVRYENKGRPPKGALYLLCDSANRGMTCDKTRWRYNDFELSFLSFVAEIDLGYVVGETASHQSEMQRFQALRDAQQGEITNLEAEREKLLELFNKTSGASADYIIGKLDYYSTRIQKLKEEVAGLTSKISDEMNIAHSALKSSVEIKDFVRKLRAGASSFDLRAKLASSLKSLVDRVYLQPSGARYSYDRDLQTKADLSIAEREHLTTMANLEGQERRNFRVEFKSGTSRTVYLNKENPLDWISQEVESVDDWYFIKPDGSRISINDPQ